MAKRVITREEYVGKVFGRWTVKDVFMKKVGVNNTNHTIFTCECECGTVRDIVAAEAIRGKSKSCGCLMKDINSARLTRHGESRTKLHGIWHGIIQRCCDPNHKDYKNYGGRGVTLCPEWRKYENFRDWALANGYSDSGSLSTDRIDNNKGYSPDNCRWVDKTTQCRNQREKRNTISGHRGVTWNEQRQKWIAGIGLHGEHIYLGGFDNLNDAIDVRKEAETQYWSDEATNFRNQKSERKTSSGYTGVCWNKKRKMWIAYIYVKDKNIHLGGYADLSDAVRVRRDAEIKYRKKERA